MRSEFFIDLTRFCKYVDKSVDWFLKGCKFKKESPEKQICLLKQEICLREARKYLRRANRMVERKLND